METAICAIPCNPGATIQLAKSLSLPMDRPTEKTKEEAEEDRFLDDMKRLTGGAEAVRNYHRHLQKQGLVLIGEHRERLTQTQAILAELLEPYLAGDGEAAPQGAPSLPNVPTLALPTPAVLSLPGG
jgi:hypothetical protein